MLFRNRLLKLKTSTVFVHTFPICHTLFWSQTHLCGGGSLPKSCARNAQTQADMFSDMHIQVAHKPVRWTRGR
jgi:hypothetical protein